MYYSDYKKKNGHARKNERSSSNYGEQNRDSYYRNSDRNNSYNDDRYNNRNTYSGYDVNSNRYNNDDRYDNRNHGGYYNENYRNSYERDRNDRDDRNVFERTSDRIKQGWNNMMHDNNDDRYNSTHSRHNSRQAGYDNGDQRTRPTQDEEYGYHHQRASYGYEGDNRSYNDAGYDHRRDGYNQRRDNRNSYYTSADRDDDYYRGYSEFDRADDRTRTGRWRGNFI